MACDIAAGRIEPCKDSIGGLDAIYFVNDGDITGYTMGTLANIDVIDSVSGTPSAYKFDLKGNSTYQEDIVSSRENGTTFFQQVLTVTLKKLDVATHKAVKLLAYGNPKVIIKDNNGNFFLAGKDFGMDVTGGTVVTGGAMGDLSGYTLVLTGMEKMPANFFDATSETELASAGFTIVAGA